jgi:hypothetical protein
LNGNFEQFREDTNSNFNDVNIDIDQLKADDDTLRERVTLCEKDIEELKNRPFG